MYQAKYINNNTNDNKNNMTSMNILSNISVISNNRTSLDNDYYQLQIYTEVKRNNSSIELWHHYLSLFSILIGSFGIFGNLISLIILIKPSKSSRLSNRFPSRKHCRLKRQPSTFSTFDHKLTNFYTYLTALSFCDFFSCIFSILNMLEHVPPPYLESYSMKYRDICMSITIITNPIVNTLQALSVWLIVAFSIHRSRSIVRTGSFLNPIKMNLIQLKNNLLVYLSMKLNCKSDESNNSFYFFKNKFKITFNYNCGCVCCMIKNKDSVHSNRIELTEFNDIECSTRLNSDKVSPIKYKAKKFNKVPIIIVVLYLFGLIYFIPQMFEKKLSTMEIQGKVYKFVTITEFGQTRLFRQIFHLWFYLFAIYVIPFVLIFISNFLLLKTYFKSKRRCSQYQLSGVSANAKIAAASMTARNSNDLNATQNSNNHLNILNENCNTTFKENSSLVTFNQEESILNTVKNCKHNTSNIKINSSNSSINLNYKNNSITVGNNRKKSNFFNQKKRLSLSNQVKTFKLNKRSKSLTITLFGVSAIFFVCHFPAAIAKIIYVLFPEIEFEDKNRLASLFLDVSNFLLILNSSINFLLYIVLGPGKFRQEFSMIFLNFCSCFNKKDKINQDSIQNKKRSLSFSVTLNNLNQSLGYDSDNQSVCVSANNNRRGSNVSFMDANKMSSNSHSVTVLKEELTV